MLQTNHSASIKTTSVDIQSNHLEDSGARSKNEEIPVLRGNENSESEFLGNGKVIESSFDKELENV